MMVLRVVPGIVNGLPPVHRTNGRHFEKSRKRIFLPTVAIAFLFLTSSIFPGASAAPLPGGTLDPLAIPQYVTPLVIPPVMKNDGAPDSYDIAVRQFRQQILPGGIWNTLNGRSDAFPPTTVWSYGPAADPTPAVAPDPGSQFNYPAYTIETTADTTVDVRWINGLVDEKTGGFLPHLLPVDQTLHWANPPRRCIDGTFGTDCRGFIPERYMGPVPIVTHVHGAHVEGHSDGFPEAWYLPDAINIPASYARVGRLFDDATGTNPGNLGYADFRYRNDQPAATLWYHDHALGVTRANVYAGPAGFWLIRGGVFDGASGGGILPGPAPVAGQTVVDLNVTAAVRNTIREIPIVIQDRSFNADGSLFYPETRAFFEGVEPRQLQIPFIPNRRSDISPLWNPEAFFNVMVVNGVSWPQLEVAPALYRFRFLNGSNSRFLWLKFDRPDVEVYQIGAEQGFLPDPVFLNALNLDGSGDDTAQLLIALAERADVIVDFRGFADGTAIELLNIGPDEPFGGGVPCPPGQNPDDDPGCGDFAPADPATTGRVMRFVVNTTLANNGGSLGASPTDPVLANGESNPDAATDPGALALNAEGALGGAAVQRSVSLNEMMSEKVCVTFLPNGTIRQVASVRPGPGFEADCAAAGGEAFGPREALLGTVDATGPDPAGIPLMWTDMTGTSTPVSVSLQNGTQVEVNVTENPTLGAVEEWSLYNFTEDAHPIHLHLVRFQVVGRTLLDGSPSPNVVQPWESGYKDTVVAFPGEITTVRGAFDIAGLYVWHCHILEHEDNEMMRPYVVSAP